MNAELFVTGIKFLNAQVDSHIQMAEHGFAKDETLQNFKQIDELIDISIDLLMSKKETLTKKIEELNNAEISCGICG